MVKPENYITIQGWMVTELKLKGNELLIYALIFGFTQTTNQNFTGSLQYVADWTNSTKQGVLKCLKNLIDKGFIEKREYYKNKVKYCEYRTTEFNGVLNKVEQGMQQSLIGGIKQSLPNNISLNNNSNNTNDIKEFTLSNESEEKPKEVKPSKPEKPKKEKKPKEEKRQSNIEARICEIKDFTETHNLNQGIYENLCVFINWLNRMTKGGVDGYTLKLHLADLLNFAGDNQVKMLEIIKNTIKCKYRCFYDLKQNVYNNNQQLPINNRKTFLDL